jgi:hypothetical protein
MGVVAPKEPSQSTAVDCGGIFLSRSVQQRIAAGSPRTRKQERHSAVFIRQPKQPRVAAGAMQPSLFQCHQSRAAQVTTVRELPTTH